MEKVNLKMRNLLFGIVGLLGTTFLSDPAMAQNRNKVVINLKNNANHSVTLLNVSSYPQEKNWTWSPTNVRPNGEGQFSAYWDDNQAPKTTVEFEGMTPGPYGCLVKCSVEVNIPAYEAVEGQANLQCSSKKPANPIFKTTSNNNVCGNVTCNLNGVPAWNTDTCNYAFNMEFNDPDHF